MSAFRAATKGWKSVSGFFVSTFEGLATGLGFLTSREIVPCPCLCFTNSPVAEPKTSSVARIPNIQPSVWKTPLMYSRRYMLFRYSSTIQYDSDRITSV
jgi:hypothetical protein